MRKTSLIFRANDFSGVRKTELRELLRDGGGALLEAARREVAQRGAADPDDVDAAVVVEAGVLGREDRLHEDVGDLRPRDEEPALDREAGDDRPVGAADLRDDVGAVARELLDLRDADELRGRPAGADPEPRREEDREEEDEDRGGAAAEHGGILTRGRAAAPRGGRGPRRRRHEQRGTAPGRPRQTAPSAFRDEGRRESRGCMKWGLVGCAVLSRRRHRRDGPLPPQGAAAHGDAPRGDGGAGRRRDRPGGAGGGAGGVPDGVRRVRRHGEGGEGEAGGDPGDPEEDRRGAQDNRVNAEELRAITEQLRAMPKK